MKKRGKLPKIECEICGNKDSKILQRHHIVPRTEVNSNNHNMNLAIICPNCHNLHHAGIIKIIGVYPSTKLPYGRTLIYEKNGVSNVPGITEPYYVPTNDSMKIYYKDEDE